MTHVVLKVVKLVNTGVVATLEKMILAVAVAWTI